jgi:MoaA/NifB/PqqE/SkfB family radical SAM enzyme
MSEADQARIRYSLFNQISDSPKDTEFPDLDSISRVVLKEVLIQPLATSWWVARNLKEKYDVDMDSEKLSQIYQSIQVNKLAQDMIRFNSLGGKAIAVARGLTLSPKMTTYYFDVQTTDACPCKCVKCWNYYEDESGAKKLLKRTADRQDAPTTEDFKRVVKEAIDLGIELMTSTGGGEPFTNRDLPEILSFAKEYSRSLGRDVRIFVPTSGLGQVYNDDILLKKAVENIDLLRFSFDSLQEDFLMKSHGVNKAGYQKMIRNFQKVIAMKRDSGLKLDIEVLVLIYGENHSSIEYTIEKARELGASRILFNSITGKENTLNVGAEELKQASQVLKSVFERYSRGEYGDLKFDFDPVLMNNLENIAQMDLDNLEPTIGDLRYCMKNVFGLTPVVTADGSFHVCFPCSQPFQANKKDIFKIGNVLDNSVNELVARMREQYRDINPKKDCISDCRDIPYFNAILRKVIDDYLFGVSPLVQPFLDRTVQEDSFVHSMHNERFDKDNLKVVLDEYEQVSRTIRKDQEIEFRQFAGEKSGDIEYFKGISENHSYQLLSRYDLNLFSVGCIKQGPHVLIFSPELRQSRSYEIQGSKLIESQADQFEDFVNRLKSDRMVFHYDTGNSVHIRPAFAPIDKELSSIIEVPDK